ncbi:hypothetical protein F2P45_05510 [Massilia sp. CCM 8733]|uniref:Uncharacterized protein n=1 Tax=Massilia mucilaginosa TaxID=2609282 RepID=A0ABX0NNZ5_9BURK|nr:hypothetical protein [Massilia mucilaginosa]NHZ88483.1 hypothetical protein [Massilia mucilaginosa]
MEIKAPSIFQGQGKRFFLIIASLSVIFVGVWYIKAKAAHAACQQKIYGEARELERKNKLSEARRLNEFLCDESFYQDPQNSEGTCRAAERLGKLFSAAEIEIKGALENYKRERGIYPDSLNLIRDQLSKNANNIAAQLVYCKKMHINDKKGLCENGTGFFSASPFMLIPVSEDFRKSPSAKDENVPILRQCAVTFF